MSNTVMEILLLICSAVCFVISFLIPEKKEGSGINQDLAKEEVKGMVKEEVDAIRGHVEEVVDESMNYDMEKTERSLERLSNEKIMAVNEYSDTVMKEIHKNHEEVMFLYDMLNQKHDHLLKTVSEASKAAKAMQDSVDSFQSFRPVEVSYGDGSVKIAPVASKRREEKSEPEEVKSAAPLISAISGENRKKAEPAAEKKKSAASREANDGVKPEKKNIVEEPERTEEKNELPAEDGFRNSNEKIMELHKQGKSNVAIAKELGLGVGEVKLVIELYKNI
ncbi:MAG: hypothetical protein J6Z35_09455 [Lachnospiraceae bacterium]|nr:hypothetical protein [Lachnospiraceae bacterium]